MLDEIRGWRVALLDLDGVVCNDTARVHYALAREWGAYFSLMVHDTPWPQGRVLHDGIVYSGWDLVYLTGRREDTRDWTEEWLQRHGYCTDVPLLMRPQDNRLPLADFKAGIIERLLRTGRRVRIYDDDPAVIERAARVPGAETVHCTWHVKQKALVKRAQT